VDVPRGPWPRGPVYHRRWPPGPQDALRVRPTCPTSTSELRDCAADGRLAEPVVRRWVTDQYDRYVRGGTVLAQPSTRA